MDFIGSIIFGNFLLECYKREILPGTPGIILSSVNQSHMPGVFIDISVLVSNNSCHSVWDPTSTIGWALITLNNKYQIIQYFKSDLSRNL